MEEKELQTTGDYVQTTSNITWCYIVSIVLAVLKAFGWTDASWSIVVSPIIIPYAIVCILWLFIVILKIIKKLS